MLVPRRAYLPAVFAVLVACGGAPAPEPIALAPAAGSMPSVSCHTTLSHTTVNGRPLVMTRCRTLAVSMAAYHTEVVYLRDLVREDRDVAAIGDHEIRQTREYESYMDSRDRWQWQLHATEAELYR